MELIEALEQLSLHVKSREAPIPANKQIISQSSDSHGLLSDGASSSMGQDASYQEWQYSPLNEGQEQLKQFENSIETLFLQIHDLDHEGQVMLCHEQAGHFSDRTLPIKPPGGSLETSQEEDSDNSSQQSSSGYATSNNGGSSVASSTNPLVVSLMKRNLQNITSTVRKLGSILALGTQIESIYKNQMEKLMAMARFGGPISSDLLGNYKSLCNSFLEILTSEPSFAHLQTILRYKQYCHLLMQAVHGLQTSGHSSLTSNDKSGIQLLDRLPIVNGDQDGEDQSMCLDDDAQDALDCALLECDQSQLEFNGWTDNQLYINSANSPPANTPGDG